MTDYLSDPSLHPMFTLSDATYDCVCSMLVGNGEICTTLGPDGYHTDPALAGDEAHATQHFVWAGRRGEGAHHPLLNFGSLARKITVDGTESMAHTWEQRLDINRATIISDVRHRGLRERTFSFVPLHLNAFLVETSLDSDFGNGRELKVALTYHLPAWLRGSRFTPCDDGAILYFAYDDLQGSIRLLSRVVDAPAETRIREHADSITIRHSAGASRHLTIRTLVQFSDRVTYAFPLGLDRWTETIEQHAAGWSDALQASAVRTGDRLVDACRAVGLYTLRSQLSPWSIGPTLSERYWGGGAFHDEMYAFYALLSGNQPDLAARMPYFRLTTLPQARARARGRGALYPWSSTEDGRERDPEGLWLTERFHLAQFAAETWALWLYERRIDHLESLYPVLKDIARYYEANVVEMARDGSVHTRPCVDFDESVGPVRDGPFTLAGAMASLRWAAAAATALGVNAPHAAVWNQLADALQRSVVSTRTTDADGAVFGIPEGAPLHYSILGHIFPFRTEVCSERALRTARFVHRICRSSRGWKPGFSPVYDGSNWIWTAGHLAIVHAMQDSPEMAWEAVSEGPSSCGPAMIPNEHVDSAGIVHVPWFTTGVGAWIYGLHALFVRVDETGTHLASAFPFNDGDASFDRLRGARGVLVSGECVHGRLTRLSVHAPCDVNWTYSLPLPALEHAQPVGVRVGSGKTRATFEVKLVAETPTELLTYT